MARVLKGWSSRCSCLHDRVSRMYRRELILKLQSLKAFPHTSASSAVLQALSTWVS